MSLSAELARGMEEVLGPGKVIKVKMLYEKEVRKYIMKIEKAHKKAAKSKLRFP